MSVLLSLPVLLPLLAAAVSLLLGQVSAVQRVLSIVVLTTSVVIAAVLLFGSDNGGPIILRLGGYAPPVGITLVADRIAALLLLVSMVVMLGVLVFAIGQRVTDLGRASTTTAFHPMYLVLCAGVSLAFLTGDLFNLFVAFEIMLSASYVLLTRGSTAARVRAGMTYVIVSLTSSLLFLTMVAGIYAATGTVNLADLSQRVPDLPPGVRGMLGLLLVVVFGIKSAVVPLHFWLPDSYPTAPAPITALFAALLTKVGVYAIIRTQTLLFDRSQDWNFLLAAALLTMLVGALGAIAQNDLNRMLSFLLVSHIGYMLFGLALFSVTGLTGVILYVVHHIAVQAALFLVSGLITRYTGTASLRDMCGVASGHPAVALLFAVPALSLAGIPPLSGFVAKVVLLRAGSETATPMAYTVTGVAVLTSFLSLYAMTRVWIGVFWGKPRPPVPDADPADEVTVGTGVTSKPMLVSAASVVAVGMAIAAAAGPLSSFSERAATDLLDRGPYQAAVLGGDDR
ncbi:formate hydrogenlyase subunit 3/multisubunit Na+/H+ antiporter, MnhD subunit [Saccharomonospora marina XMU15]|uniref:Formate hydrogenlyase subunit 3/multisubunit Na+/H+ antiporter, MnhD subunit n=1 Tax=Saccharomonospora marina XMU15 TaxID=882083 RepID=H5WWQ7_9PSEU|nr:Na+/H+ antiporter subunit D [Saccharomonospora marina]EHR51670.1 formate hydrogenlyase subunit 3/multisubunit Na+/H+ antiporter, MnhD subunit [Saccharomonospora marina XMU15]